MVERKTGESGRSTSELIKWGIGNWICTAAGVVVGAITGNILPWLLGGAAVGIVIGSLTNTNKNKN